MRKKGFTLIELLVVIAIIAILAAILMPVFAQAREKARQASCLSNTKQMALAIHMYTNDYDERLPLFYFGDWLPCCANRGGHWPWPKALIPYVKNKPVYTCPSLPGAHWDRLLGAYGPGFAYEFPSVIGYGYNAYGLNDLPGDPPAVGKSLAQIDKPAETFAIVETRYYPPGHPSHVPDWGWYFAYPPAPRVGLLIWSQWLTANRHQDGNHVVFADGHAKWQRYDFITHPRSLPQWNVPPSWM
ncbi:MAG: DUF1559 domain-containing protein [Abditibacteriales bacterium]|nr:DUF1559 domain-containing protein [Abditibacteriales bacterium]MDW8365257.1 DUF1559 domain-containing protein [Abditibacteriales bacterium]